MRRAVMTGMVGAIGNARGVKSRQCFASMLRGEQINTILVTGKHPHGSPRNDGCATFKGREHRDGATMEFDWSNTRVYGALVEGMISLTQSIARSGRGSWRRSNPGEINQRKKPLFRSFVERRSPDGAATPILSAVRILSFARNGWQSLSMDVSGTGIPLDVECRPQIVIIGYPRSIETEPEIGRSTECSDNVVGR